MHAWKCVRACVRMWGLGCVCTSACVGAWVRTRMRACECTRTREHMRACTRACMYGSVCASMRSCVSLPSVVTSILEKKVRAGAYVFACVCARMSACVCACLRVCMCARAHVCVHARVCACMHACTSARRSVASPVVFWRLSLDPDAAVLPV